MVKKLAALAPAMAPPTMAAVSFAADENRVSFLHLSGEIRNQIYEEMLPVLGPWGGYDFPFKGHGKDGLAAFMASCRQVHEEATSMFRRPERLEVRINHEGAISIDGRSKRIPFDDLEQANFSDINNIKHLFLEVHVDTHHQLCQAQDALFSLLGHMRTGHKLEGLRAHFMIGSQRGYGVMSEFKGISPGSISRGHQAAFLSDPLRTIRNLKDRDGNKRRKGWVALHFVGRSGRPWREIEGEVQALARGNDPVPDYEVFQNYYQKLRRTVKLLNHLNLHGSGRMNDAVLDLHMARIRGDVAVFRTQHADFLAEVARGLPSAYGLVNANHLYLESPYRIEAPEQSDSEWLETLEQQEREVQYLTHELEQSLPSESTDSSFFGFRESDDKLREWQDHGREEALEQKKERKRVKEAKRKREEEEAADESAEEELEAEEDTTSKKSAKKAKTKAS